MTASASPLRYPGGKSCLTEIVSTVLRLNGLERGHYGEPYAGGCGLALSLLYGGHVADIHINDIDPSIWCFWHSVLHDTPAFIDLVLKTPITIAEWRNQKEIHRARDKSNKLGLGFAAFFLNRTNRSGVIKDAGVIGGLEQRGVYKIDCRFNREDLARRILRISKYRSRIHLSRLDALQFLDKCDKRLPQESLLFIDPPYFKKGSSLYTNFYRAPDHAALAEKVTASESKWIVTYDDAQQVRSLYRHRRQYRFDINYSLHEKRVGTELFIASKGLKLPSEMRERQVNKPQYRAA